MPKTIVRLKVLSSQLSPEAITERLGLACDRCWHIGELRHHTIIEEDRQGWVLGSGLPKTAELQEHVAALLSRISPHTDSVKALSTTSVVELSCVIHADSAPALNFDPETIERIARLGASLDIDLTAGRARDAARGALHARAQARARRSRSPLLLSGEPLELLAHLHRELAYV